MIHVYGLSYYTTSYIIESINCIYGTSSEPIYLTVVDNKSENSDEIRTLVRKGSQVKGVNRLIGMKGNSRGNALIDVVRQFPPDDSEDFFVITDLDLRFPSNMCWAKELRDCRAKGANIAGFNLSKENYVWPNRGHDDVGIGWWMMLLDKKRFFELPKNVAYTDHYLISQLGPLYRASRPLYHLNWDCWKDYPEYFALKDKGIPWNERTENEIEEIYEF